MEAIHKEIKRSGIKVLTATADAVEKAKRVKKHISTHHQ